MRQINLLESEVADWFRTASKCQFRFTKNKKRKWHLKSADEYIMMQAKDAPIWQYQWGYSLN